MVIFRVSENRQVRVTTSDISIIWTTGALVTLHLMGRPISWVVALTPVWGPVVIQVILAGLVIALRTTLLRSRLVQPLNSENGGGGPVTASTGKQGERL